MGENGTIKQDIESLRYEIEERLIAIEKQFEESPEGETERLREENRKLKKSLEEAALAVRRYMP